MKNEEKEQSLERKLSKGEELEILKRTAGHSQAPTSRVAKWGGVDSNALFQGIETPKRENRYFTPIYNGTTNTAVPRPYFATSNQSLSKMFFLALPIKLKVLRSNSLTLS